MKFWIWMATILLLMASIHAEAGRLGGGRSIGRQSGNVTQRQVAPSQGAFRPAAPAAPMPGVAPKRPWGAMLGGLAAGLGLAWLANSLGLGGAFSQILMFALLAMLVVMAVRWLMRSRRATQGQTGGYMPFAFQGASHSNVAPIPVDYRPENVGNDASARPWERPSMVGDTSPALLAATGSLIGSNVGGSRSWAIPAGFDVNGFLQSAKTNFVSLQAAWDQSDMNALRVMMTDSMLKEIQAQLAEREAHTGGPVNLTEVVMIDAQLLGIEDLGDDYLASVEFSGMIREQPSAGASPFREVWNMIKPKNGSSGWLVAGVQALQ